MANSERAVRSVYFRRSCVVFGARLLMSAASLRAVMFSECLPQSYNNYYCIDAAQFPTSLMAGWSNRSVVGARVCDNNFQTN